MLAAHRHNNLPHANIEEDLECYTEADNWKELEECRRLVFSRTLDGAKTSCDDIPDCQLCDFCHPDSPLLDALRDVIPDPPPQPQAVDQIMAAPMTEFAELGNDEFPDTTGIDWDAKAELPFLLGFTQDEGTPNLPRNDNQVLANPPSHLVPPTMTAPSMPVLMATSF